MTHTGKIGRLPKNIIVQLNRRLDDHQPGPQLLAWLNVLPEVQALLQTQFAGRPVSPQNLSEWKKRGYPEWQRWQERLDTFRQLQPGSPQFQEDPDPKAFNRSYCRMLAIELLLTIRESVPLIPDPRQRVQANRVLSHRFIQMCNSDLNPYGGEFTEAESKPLSPTQSK